MFVICVEAIIYLLLYNLYDCTFKTILTISKINYKRKFSWVVTSARLYHKYIVKIVLFITYDPWQIYLLLMIHGRYIFYLWSMADISFTYDPWQIYLLLHPKVWQGSECTSDFVLSLEPNMTLTSTLGQRLKNFDVKKSNNVLMATKYGIIFDCSGHEVKLLTAV